MKRVSLMVIQLSLCLGALEAGSQEIKPSAVLSLYTGQSFVWHQGKLAEAELGQALESGDSVRTGKGSLAEIGFTDGTCVRLGEKSSLCLQRADSSDRSLRLLLGKIWTKVAKLSLKSQFTVETPTAVAGVRGTAFKVEIQPDSGTRVAVEEGLVEVSGPGRRGKMLRLAALRQSFMRRGQEPSESGFDPQKENRWERWSLKMFQEQRQAAMGLMSGLEQAVKSQERTWDNARKLEGKRQGAEGLYARSREIERQAYQNRRKFKLLRLRLERRLHQTLVLADRVEGDSGQAGPGAQAGELQNQIEALGQRYQTAEAGILEIVEKLPSGYDSYPAAPGYDAQKIMARLNTLKDKSAPGLAALREAERSCDDIEPKLSGLLQDLAQIKELAENQPLLAKQQFILARQSYLALKASNNGFDFPVLDKLLPETRSLAAEARVLMTSMPDNDANYMTAKDIADNITVFTRNAIVVKKRLLKIDRQALLFERLTIELSLLLRL